MDEPERAFAPGRAERWRAGTVGAALLFCFAALGYRLYGIEVAQAPHWRAVAIRQQKPLREIAAYRGDIRSADGRVLARSIRAPSAFAEPRHMGRKPKGGPEEPPEEADLARAARTIAGALGYDRTREQALLERLRDPAHRAFAWIERRLDRERAARLQAALKAHRTRGVSFRDEYRREYPEGQLAAHVLGLLRLDPEGELEGLSGIEAACDRELRGVSGLREVIRDGAGGTIIEDGLIELPPEDGARVTLTIDANIQGFCEDALRRAAEEWRPEGIACVALVPRDGRILALASWPTYDPGRLSDLTPRSLRCRPTMDTFEPGSILKPLVAGYAVEAGAVSPSQRFDCASPARFGARTVRDVHSYGTLSFAEVISHSSNVGMTRIAMALGPAGLVEVLRRAGFGRATGLGLPLEEPGITTPLARWSYHSTVSVAQGYELAVTPVQMASAFAALANGGVRMRPRIIERIEDARGRIVADFAPAIAERILDEKTAREVMLPALARVVEEGTGKKAHLERWTVGGKTGTAKKVEGRGYASGRYRSSFCGFAPLEDPRLCVLVMVDDPRSNGPVPYGGTVAAPVVGEILERSLAYLGTPPSPREVTDAERARTRASEGENHGGD